MFTQVIIRKGKKGRTDGRTTGGRTDRHTDVKRETIILHHYCVVGYKNENRVTVLFLTTSSDNTLNYVQSFIKMHVPSRFSQLSI